MKAKAKTKEVKVDVDEAALDKRREDTERFMSDPRIVAEMEAGRRALEAEMAAKQAEEPPVVEMLPEDDEANQVVFGSPVSQPKAGQKAPVWVAKARRAIPPRDPDNEFEPGRVVDVEVRLYSDKTEYRMTYLKDGVETDFWSGRERDGWGAWLAMRRIKIDKDADYSPVNKLPRLHPAEVRRREAVERYWANQPIRRGRGREHFRDLDIVTGQPIGWSDGVNSWR